MQNSLHQSRTRNVGFLDLIRVTMTSVQRRRKHVRDLAYLRMAPDELLDDIGLTRRDVIRGHLPTRR